MPFDEGTEHVQLGADVVALSGNKVSKGAESDRQRGDVVDDLADAPSQLGQLHDCSFGLPGRNQEHFLREAGPGLDRPSLFPRGTTIQFLDENIYEEIK